MHKQISRYGRKPRGQDTCRPYKLLLFVLVILLMSPRALAVMESKLWEPVDWSFENPGYSGNPYDLVAKARFTHSPTKQKIRTELFYDLGDTWKLRFTGTRTGQWRFVIEISAPELNELKGQIKVLPNRGVPGFMTNFGNKWGRLGVDEAFVPQICDSLDYSSYQQHRPNYDIYVKAIEQYPDKPTFLEDRFRVRKDVYPEKDYDFDMTRRGLWHSTMAGGAANIWGNLLGPHPFSMSNPYPNKNQILTWSRFWKDRFRKEMVRANNLTDGVCLKVPGRMLIFYKEDTNSIRMDLTELLGAIEAVAVDARRDYEEIAISGLETGQVQVFEAPVHSDWAVAVRTR